MWRTLLILALALPAVAGCRSLTGCDKESRVTPAMWVDLLRDEGWDCRWVAQRRNAVGQLEDMYECTRCR